MRTVLLVIPNLNCSILVREKDNVLSDWIAILISKKNHSISHSVLKLDHKTKYIIGADSVVRPHTFF